MFCAKCGKKIDDDSAFCPSCGQKTNAPVEAESPSRGVPEKAAPFEKMKNKMPLIGIAIAFVAVVAVVFGIVKVIGGSKFGRTFSEKLFAMPWEEISEMSEKEYRNIIEEEGILCEAYTSSYGDWAVMTKTTDKFMGYDCLSIHFSKDMEGDGFGAMSDFSAHITLYALAYETADDFKEGRGKLEDYLKKHSIKNSTVFTMEDGDGITTYFYPVEVSNRNMDIFQNQMDELMEFDVPETETLAREAGERFDNCSVYKFVAVRFVEKDDLQYFDWGADFPSDKSYTDYACEMLVYYTPMTEEGYISYASAFGYDAISGKEIDIDKFKESLDDAFIESEGFEEKLNGYASEMREASEKLYFSMLYMLEKHDFDILSSSYFKSDNEKRLWYINNFKWDINTKAPVDLAEYRNSTDIYCAVEFNYNVDINEYFESDLDKALYLADRNYIDETGGGFGGTDEKRLYFLQNYSYDTSAGKVIDREIVDALIAYQKYVNQCIEENEDIWSWNLLYGNLFYLNDDNIPDLVLVGDPQSIGRMPMEHTIYLVSYTGGQLVEQELMLCLGDETLRYTPKAGLICVGGGQGSYDYDDNGDLEASVTYYEVIKLEDTFEEIGSTLSTEIYQWMSDEFLRGEYSVNDAEVESQEKVDEYLNSFGFTESSKIYGWQSLVSFEGSKTATLLDLYDDLRTTEYLIYAYAFTGFELSDGILTFSSDYGAQYGESWENEKKLSPYSYSYPVAEECTWEHYGVGEDVPYKITDYEGMKAMVDYEMESYRKQFEKYGDIDWDSPQAYYIKVTDGIIVSVYTISP